MPVIKELIRTEADNTISFGNYELDTKSKVEDFEIEGDIYKVKTYNEITKLEKNGMFVYESVPGTTVNNLKFTDKEVSFNVEGAEDAQITLELDETTEYKVLIDDTNVGKMKTNLSGKLVLSVELSNNRSSDIKIVRI